MIKLPSKLEIRILQSVNKTPKYGLQIVKDAGLNQNGIYVILGRMVKHGYLEVADIEQNRPLYRATKLGKRALKAYDILKGTEE